MTPHPIIAAMALASCVSTTADFCEFPAPLEPAPSPGEAVSPSPPRDTAHNLLIETDQGARVYTWPNRNTCWIAAAHMTRHGDRGAEVISARCVKANERAI